MKMRVYDAVDDYPSVDRLWDDTLGSLYPVSRRVLLPRVGWRVGFENKNGICVWDENKLVGFGLVDTEKKGDNLIGFISCIIVATAYQRKGIGGMLLSAMERRLCEIGCSEIEVTGGNYRFWSGVPCELTPAINFLSKNGFILDRKVMDLTVSFDGKKLLAPLLPADFELRKAEYKDIGALFAFEQLEFPNWVSSMSVMIAAGDIGNIITIWRKGVLVGVAQSYTPGSKWRGPNVVWEKILGEKVGGLGCVGIAKSWRGKGLGNYLCNGVLHHIAEEGANCCLIDWTDITEFYYKTCGAVIWREFLRGVKKIR